MLSTTTLACGCLVTLILCNIIAPSSSSPCPPNFPPPNTSTVDVFCVDNTGCCNFTTIQAAVDAVPNHSAKRSVVWIKDGVYNEKVTVPDTKTNVTFQGQGWNVTWIVWHDTARTANSTYGSASVTILADGFVAKNISFKNAAPAAKPGDKDAQAVALRIRGDRAAFWGCGFFSTQDTLFDEMYKHYFKECFIEGTVDFIFGDGLSLYENCTLNSVADEEPKGQHFINGAITAQARRFAENNTGFSFVNCKISGTGYILLGRAWKPYSRVVFAYTYIPNIVAMEGWGDWGDKARDSTVFYGEYGCTGAGANMSGRVSYAKSLDDKEVQRFLTTSYIDGDKWLLPFNDSLVSAT